MHVAYGSIVTVIAIVNAFVCWLAVQYSNRFIHQRELPAGAPADIRAPHVKLVTSSPQLLLLIDTH